MRAIGIESSQAPCRLRMLVGILHAVRQDQRLERLLSPTVCWRLFQCCDVMQGTFVQERVYSAPCGRVHDLAMPHHCSDLVASCSHEEIRLWDISRQTELLRIEQPSKDFLCLTIPKVQTPGRIIACCTCSLTPRQDWKLYTACCHSTDGLTLQGPHEDANANG